MNIYKHFLLCVPALLFVLSEINGNVAHCQNKTMLVPYAAARAGPASVLSRRLEAGPRALTGLCLISGLCIPAAPSHTLQGHHSININNADTRGVSLQSLRCPPPPAHCSGLPDVQVVMMVSSVL